jgi:hypothetical protein
VVFVTILVGAEIAAVIALHRLGTTEGFALRGTPIRAWLRDASTEDLVAVGARFAGLALGWWLLAASLLSLARRAIPSWRHLRALDALSPAVLRRTLDRALVVGLGASIAFTGIQPAVATSSAPAARVDVPVVRSAAQPTAPAPPVRAHALTTAPSPNRVVVHAGDNLWVIARRALDAGGRGSEPPEITPYWRRVIAANESSLRSHDPNLIFPGEAIVLPPLADPAG